MKHRLMLLVAVTVVCAFCAATAAPPETMSYQGVLNDGAGVPVADGTYSLTFKIYDQATGGTALWTETQSVLVEGGIFNVILGSVTALAVPFDDPYWLGTSVAGDPELTPRVELASAPYAFRALHGDDDWATMGSNIYRVTGNIGVGTNAPSAKLEVGTGAQRALNLSNSGTGFDMTLHAENPSGNVSGFYTMGAVAAYPGTPTAVFGSAGAGGNGGFFTCVGDANYGLIAQSKNDGTALYGWAFDTGYAGYFSGGKGLRCTGMTETGQFKMASGAANGYVLTSDGTGVGTWQPASGGGTITGAGTTSYIPKFTGTTSIGNSIMYETGGSLYIPSSKAREDEAFDKDGKERERLDTKLAVSGENGWTTYTDLYETDTTSDGRTALYAYRSRSTRNDGTGYDYYETNTAITGYNYWGDTYTFGVAGYTYGDYDLTGGVLGYHRGGDVWGSLGYEDSSGGVYGVYTPDSAWFGGEIVAWASAIEGTEIQDGTITNIDISATANIADTKISGTAWTHSGDGYPPRADYNTGSGFVSTSSTYVTVTSQNITLPAGGYVFAEASAASGYWNGSYEGMMAIGFGSTTEDYYTERWFTFNSSDEMMPVSTSRIYYLGAGTHTIYFLAKRFSGSGSVWFPRYTLSVIFIDQLGKAGEVSEPPKDPEPRYRAVDGVRN
jgi:hypothetical protein